MDRDEVMEGLRAAGERRTKAKQDARLDTPEVRALVHNALRLDPRMPVRDIAALLGASHEAVYALIREEAGPQEQ